MTQLANYGPPGEPKRVRVSREEAVAVALEVEIRERRGQPVPKWMRRVAAAI
jgi:hypothetical protein